MLSILDVINAQNQRVVSELGYTHQDLADAFSEIQNSENWKLPVDAWIHPDSFEIYNEACVYFTGSALKRVQWAGEHAVRVSAAGYYAAIGA